MPDLHPFGGRMSRHFGKSLNPGDPYLSYYDVRLFKEDVMVVKNDWLTDNVISFWEEYLEHEYLCNFPKSRILLVRPTMTFLLMQTEDPRTLKDALPDFANATHAFLPVTDADSARAESGTHWSLLLVSLVDGVAFHYDSLPPPANINEAHHATNQLSKLIGRPINFIQLRDTPRQDNSADCGVYVCVNMRHLLLKRLLLCKEDEKVNMSMGGRRIDATEARKEMLKIVEEFRKEGERRRSLSASPASREGQGSTGSASNEMSRESGKLKKHAKRQSRSPPRIDSPVEI